tara:strand:- start:24 stop:146 length:123 start_codon:yes stop_codon:yes gene_type:complete
MPISFLIPALKTFHAVQPEVVLTWSIEVKYSNTAALNFTG